MGLVVQGGYVLDGRGHEWRSGKIVIENGRISRVQRGGSGTASRENAVLDAEGMWVLPGLIDCHVHITKGTAVGDREAWICGTSVDDEAEQGFFELTSAAAIDALRGAHHAAATLAAGYTTVRDLGGARGYADIALREAIRRGRVCGPRVLACGGGLAMTGGHWWNVGLIEIDGEVEARRMARRQLKAGADVIKVMASRAGSAERCPGGPELTVGEMQEVCEVARRCGVRVSAHAVGAESVKNAVLAGVDTIEHGCFSDEEALRLMSDRGVVLVTTLYAYDQQAKRSEELGWPRYVADRSREIMNAYPEVIRSALEMGVPIAPGSDTGQAILTPHGKNAAELVLLSELVGLSAEDVIVLATSEAARALGMEDQIGSIEEGKRADLVLFDRDPRSDVNVLCQRNAIRAVVRGGTVFRPGEGMPSIAT